MSNNAEQDISTSTESIVIENSLAKLKNDDPTSEFVVKSDCGDLGDQLCNSFANNTNQMISAGDPITDVGFLSSALLIPESDVTVSSRSTDDESMQKTAFSVEELIGPAIEIDMKLSPSYVSVVKPECLEEPIIQVCDEEDTTTESKSKRRSVWKRTKRFFRRLFCCGDVKVRHPSFGIIAEPTDFVDDKIDISSLPATEELILIDSSQSAGVFLPQPTLRIDDFRAPIATDCEPTDPPTVLLEEEFSGLVNTDIELPATEELILIDSSQSAGVFLPQPTLRIDDFRAPIATDCEPTDPPTVLLEEEFSGLVNTDIELPATEELILIDSSQSAGVFLPQPTLRIDDFRAPIATDYEPTDPPTVLLEEEFSGLVNTDIEQSNCHIEGPLNERSASMRILDLPTESAGGDKHDIDDWPPTMIEVIERISAISMVELPRSTSLEKLNGPIETNVQRPMYDLEGPLYKRFVSMTNLDLPTEFAGNKVDIDDWPPAMIEVIEPVVSITKSPRSIDQYQLETTLQVEELNGQIETDAKQFSCDSVDLSNQVPVSDLLIIEAKPKHRALWKRILCCCC